jgi:hypothetical protein
MDLAIKMNTQRISGSDVPQVVQVDDFFTISSVQCSVEI